MKTNLFVSAILAACVVLVCKAEEDGKAIDWSVVLKKISEIEKIATGAVEQIKTIAKKDNPSAAQALEPKIDSAVKKGLEVLKKASKSLENKSLNEDEGKALFTEFQTTLLGIQSDASEELKKFSKDANSELQTVFLTAFGQVTQKANDIFKLLRGKKE